MAKWSDLSQDVLVSIANLMVLVEDFLAFGLVCTSWRLAATKENFTGSLSQQVPLLLLSPRNNTKTAAKSVSEFYNMRKGKTHKLSPALLAKINDVHSSSLGWVFIVSEDFGVALLHPFSHHPMVKLPNFMEDERFREDWNMFALSSSPSSKSDYLVMAVNRWKRLAFCRPGGDGWTIVNEEHVNHPAYHDITYYKGQYYIVDAEGQVWVCDIDDPKQARKRALNGHPIPVKPENFNQGQFYYLMESGGVLLAVQCTTKNYEARYFRVFEVPFDNGDWLDSEVTNLGNRTLFLGSCSSFSVEASTDSGCKTNCIYFNQPLYGCSNFGVFTMEDRKINKNVAEYWFLNSTVLDSTKFINVEK